MKNLVRSTFRTLSKNGRKVDESLSLRTLLAAVPSRAYVPSLENFVDLSFAEQGEPSPLNAEIRQLNNGRDWFIPETIAVSSSSPTPSPPPLPRAIVQSHIAQRFRSTPLTAENMKLAFEAVKCFSETVELEKAIRLQMEPPSVALHEASTAIESRWKNKGVMWTPSSNIPYDMSGSPKLRLLVAHPLMPSFFRHTVIVVVQFREEHGAEGWIVNQPLINHERILHQLWAVTASQDDPLFQKLSQHPVMIGGPVQNSNRDDSGVSVMHMVQGIPEAEDVGLGLFLGGDHAALSNAIDSGTAKATDMVITAGKSVWGKGQLEGEIASGSWLCVNVDGSDDALREIMFGPSESLVDYGLKQVMQPLATWTAVLRSSGTPFEGMAALTHHRLQSDEGR